MTDTTPAASTVTITRTFDAPPAQVFDALTTAEILADWFWPWSPAVMTEPGPNGVYRILSNHPNGAKLAVQGRYDVVEKPHRLEFSWQWEDTFGAPSGTPTHVRITLELNGAGTRLDLEHGPFATPDDQENHRIGWDDCLDRLASYVAERARE